MTTFQHKTLPVIISYSEWSKLDSREQSNFTICNSNQVIVNNNTNSETTDLLGLGKAVETVVVAPIAVGLGILNKIF